MIHLFFFQIIKQTGNKIYRLVFKFHKVMITMQLGEKLANLKLDQSLIKELDQEDIQFAEKEYKKLYAQQMSKISWKMQRIEKVKQHLNHIEQQQASKQKEIKQNLQKKCLTKQKNKDKILNEKLKSYRIHHQLWEHKLQNIKRKNKQELKHNVEQLKKYKDQVDKFWKTKTQEITNLANKRKQYQARCQSFNRKEKKIEHQKIKTELRDSSIPEFKRQNTRKTEDNEKNIAKINLQNENKTIRFLTQNSIEFHSINTHSRKNDSHFTNKHSIHSLRDHRDSKNSITMPQMDQNKFSQNLQSNHNVSRLKSHSQFPHVQNNKNLANSRKNQNDSTANLSFQKAMKKLDKIHKIRVKHQKKTKQNDKNLSPCQPRKAIDAQGYRRLRAKTQARKDIHKSYTEQNLEQHRKPYKPSNTLKFITRNQTAVKESRYQNMRSINQSRLSVSGNIKKLQQFNTKQRQSLQESQKLKWKKDKILKAIRDKIFKIKIEEIQKLNKSKTSF